MENDQLRVRPTVTRGEKRDFTSEYAALAAQVRAAGLLRRRRGFYALVLAVLTAATGALVWAIVSAGDSAIQLAFAAISGVVLAQFGFVAHEAAHREVLGSGRANDALGVVIANGLVGISYSNWKLGHNKHHARPNVAGRDPSVQPGVFSFRQEDSQSAHGLYAWYLKRQGYLFFPILLLSGLNLYLESFRTVLRPGKVHRRGLEIALIAAHFGVLAGLFLVMSPGHAIGFVAVQVAVFGLSIGSSFAPNHVGMPILEHSDPTDFLRRQVITSRNIVGTDWLVTAWMGGLNYQIEHHLFPTMPRPNLREASVLVRAYCAERGITYTESRLFASYAGIVRYLNEVGEASPAVNFTCPVASRFGR
jgi:fatty acid desaturase